MVSKPNRKVIVIKRSLLTGKIVWVYRGTSYEGARKAYWRACKKEVRRVRQWSQLMLKRKKSLLRLITHSDSSSVSSSTLRKMSPRQRKLAREIIKMAETPPPMCRDFYDHIMEEYRRRNWQSKRWRENREKLFRYGQTHVPSEYKPNGRPRGGDRRSKKASSEE